MVNGKLAQLDRVKNLFRSVQLNVNNPHFLIMQGRITKVLNMKADEILGLIKEVAGTKMYEDKKEAVLNIFKKKEGRVKEINKILDEEITPTLNNLKQQQEQYYKWLENKRTQELLEKLKIAYQYWKAEKSIEGAKEAVECSERIKNLKKKRRKIVRPH